MIIMLVLQLLNRNYENVFLCILTLLLLVIPSLAQITFKVELPTAFGDYHSCIYFFGRDTRRDQ